MVNSLVAGIRKGIERERVLREQEDVTWSDTRMGSDHILVRC